MQISHSPPTNCLQCYSPDTQSPQTPDEAVEVEALSSTDCFRSLVWIDLSQQPEEPTGARRDRRRQRWRGEGAGETELHQESISASADLRPGAGGITEEDREFEEGEEGLQPL